MAPSRRPSVAVGDLRPHGEACGGDHEAAPAAAPETTLPVTHAARVLLRGMEAGFRGR
ncbi:hypothetical protein [Singulisphaera sp. PoT]|uniref:hypothetical protein n=1 Tax=Singulisphaera sp. PoT TaxID=3411797 RepID=UPI003BF5483D